MRVGIYDPYLDDLGGGEKYMVMLALCLTGKHEVSIFWDSKKDMDNLSERFGLDTSRINVIPNIFTPKVSFLKRFLATRKYDVIIFLSDGSIPLVWSKKLFIHIQQPLDALQSKSPLSILKRRRITGFFSNSLYTQEFIQKKFHINSSVLYPPVALFPKNIKKKNSILHVGRFRVMDSLSHAKDYKKQFFMVEVFREMIDKGLRDWDFHLAVSVKDAEKGEFEKLQKSAKGYPIHFYINKKNEELWSLYSESKIYWHASGYGEDLEAHPEYAEHFGISTVEAMGAGCVPVVINAGGQKEIVTDGVNGILWATKEELQTKTLEVIHNKPLLEKLSVNAKKRALDFSKENFCDSVNNMIS